MDEVESVKLPLAVYSAVKEWLPIVRLDCGTE